MGIDIRKMIVNENWYRGEFGLEKESLRVNEAGYLSTACHPFGVDDRIERDFCESQTEMITGVWNTVQGVCEELRDIHVQALKKLAERKSGREYLWPFSNPPIVRDKDIRIANYEGSLAYRKQYREYLAKKYGRKKMLFCGIHFNFSFAGDFFRELLPDSGQRELQELKNNLYLELAKKLTKYSWFIVYLTAASPVFDSSFGEIEGCEYASPRCSAVGYWNDFVPVLSYGSLEEYVESIQKYVDQGLLREAKELYYPVRLKPRSEYSLETLLQNGINHIELRMLDLNPLSMTGVLEQDLSFIHLLILYLVSLEEEPFGEEEQKLAVQNMQEAARYEDEEVMIEMTQGKPCRIRSLAMEILVNMKQFFEELDNKEALTILDWQFDKLNNPKGRYAVLIREKYASNFVEKGMELACQYTKECMKEGDSYV